MCARRGRWSENGFGSAPGARRGLSSRRPGRPKWPPSRCPNRRDVIGPADQPEQCDRLVGGHPSSIPGRLACTNRFPLAGSWAPPEPKIASDCVSVTAPVRLRSQLQTAPIKRRLASGHVIIEGRTGVVVGPSEHCFPVVIYGSAPRILIQANFQSSLLSGPRKAVG